jgi:hypothetical protein
VSTKNITYEALRKQLDDPYFVQWITATNRHGELIIMGYCVRDKGDSHWATVFKHEDRVVCEKVCQMLNENKEGANKC